MRLIAAILLLFSCTNRPFEKKIAVTIAPTINIVNNSLYDSSYKTIHVLVALCDNKYQGIVPVPAKIGNGQDPDNNLYWGCAFGVRSYFKNSKEWIFLRKEKLDSIKIERLIFKHKTANYYLIADAYDGRYIKQATIDLLQSCSGRMKDAITINNKKIGIYGNANLLAFIGHDGLMDFKLTDVYKNADGKIRDAIILACKSKTYFAPHLKPSNARALVWSTGLMSPEAYTLHDALTSYVNNRPLSIIRNSAADAYAKYQHCSRQAAMNLLVSGY